MGSLFTLIFLQRGDPSRYSHPSDTFLDGIILWLGFFLFLIVFTVIGNLLIKAKDGISSLTDTSDISERNLDYHDKKKIKEYRKLIKNIDVEIEKLRYLQDGFFDQMYFKMNGKYPEHYIKNQSINDEKEELERKIEAIKNPK